MVLLPLCHQSLSSSTWPSIYASLLNFSHTTMKKILEQHQVSAPPGSVPSTTIPLSFFDLPWLYCPPNQRLFFFDFPHPTHYFLQTLLPTLKHTLSLTLQHFFPYTSSLLLPPHHPQILYNDGDSLPFTVAESSADFSGLISNSPTDVTKLHHLIPELPLPRTLENGTRLVSPLMAIQVTILPNSGLALGLTFNHVAGDGRSFHHFIKWWAYANSLSLRSSSPGGPLLTSVPLHVPNHRRDVIQDPRGLELVYLKELMSLDSKSLEFACFVDDVSSNKVRATFTLTHDQIEKLKKWASLRGFSHISTFVLTCSLIWVCKIKAEYIAKEDGNIAESHFLFVADCRNHAEFNIPCHYFGNCLDISIMALEKGGLIGENGLVEAVSAMERKVRERKSDPLKGSETLMSDVRELDNPGRQVFTVAGSTRLGVYETDFGWGKPRKSEVVHIEFSESVSISDSRHSEVAIEIGVVLKRTQMNFFADILDEELRRIEII